MIPRGFRENPKAETEECTMAASPPDPNDAPDFAADFAAFSTRLSLATLPPGVVEVVRTDILDTLACADRKSVV